MQNNRIITIAVGSSRKSLNWQNTSLMWSEFVEKLKSPQRTNESLEEFLKLKKAAQDQLKDVGGFVGGSLNGLRRKNNNVVDRDLITLDLDNINTGMTDSVVKKVNSLGCAYVIYSTRKHAEYAPRLRVIIPVDRSISPDEYEPIARKLASIIGIQMADPTTFEVSRLMFWPSCSNDSDYVYEFGDMPFCSADGVLAMYEDWTDVSTWPQVPGHDITRQREVARQQDPETKRGVIGAFCRTYDIYNAMEKFIPKAYESTADDNRFTYLGGSTSGGAIVYDGKFLYSHHATDPCSNTLVNAFDMVRLHLFGNKDEGAKEGTPVSKLPSFVEMSKLAIADDKVSALINAERHEKAMEAFTDDYDHSTEILEDDISWMEKLDINPNTGAIDKTINNMVLIMENAKDLKGKMALDEFANRGMVLGSLPWNDAEEKRLWADVDDAELARYLEVGFNITGREKRDMALLIVSARNKFNDVKSYLESLKWDGTKRINTLLRDYLGAEDNIYTADVMRKSLAAAVGRAIHGGIKYDYMPILAGAQGIGKSTFLRILGKEWFSDSLQCFEGKEAAEMIQGTWINELGELTVMSRSETNAVKQFLSKQEDIYREAYGRRTNKYPRRCVFFGTTNNAEFLKDITGNRRFWPVDCGLHEPTKNIFTDLEQEVDQIWAEAYMIYILGEPLYLTGESLKLSEEAQELHQEQDSRKGIIEDFLEIEIPENWYDLSLNIKRQYLNGNANIGDVKLIKRDRTCAIEIWAECFGFNPNTMQRRDASEINNILESIKGWERYSSSRSFGDKKNNGYGKQKGFQRKTILAEFEESGRVLEFKSFKN
ncbi:MAG: virulence-associated E family protein [Tissierellia bacterium]|nr:virulence-associated E family protein [Tissierellia bacterium]